MRYRETGVFVQCGQPVSPLDTMDYFEGLHVPLKTERGNRVFPVSDRAADIVDAMKEDVEASAFMYCRKT